MCLVSKEPLLPPKFYKPKENFQEFSPFYRLRPGLFPPRAIEERVDGSPTREKYCRRIICSLRGKIPYLFQNIFHFHLSSLPSDLFLVILYFNTPEEY